MFEEDLKRWKKTEQEFAKRLIDWGLNRLEFAPNKQFKDWDVRIEFEKLGQNVIRTFEIKDDMISEKTWNIWFEVRCNSKPSWIYASKADYIVYRLWDKFYYQDRWELIYALNDIPHTQTLWWDGNRALLYIVDKKYLSDLFKEL
jgi:hypothetical protein